MVQVQTKRNPAAQSLEILGEDGKPLTGDHGASSLLTLSWRVVPFVRAGGDDGDDGDAGLDEEIAGEKGVGGRGTPCRGEDELEFTRGHRPHACQ